MSEIQHQDFNEVLSIIEHGRAKAVHSVNVALIETYWAVGAYLFRKVAEAGWGKGVVKELASWLATRTPGLRGFSAQNLWRMKQFYETYAADQKLSPLVRDLNWTHNLIIFSQSKRPKEREFYLRMAIQEKWDKRELEGQIKAALFERAVLQPAHTSAALTVKAARILPSAFRWYGNGLNS
ncbi:MAG: hypothetical protein CVV27_01035 [Candidatus Melainabacteria bacterium HGW-Melainabacteria-1]|nr:MAG: hypothetical protein CVV27_01035 [Candidatus Melainabacteria bacterium HGW-Melainabacteria-1]